MSAFAASSLLSRPVTVDGILIGHVVDVLLDSGAARALGLEVRCGDGEHRFLPLAAARLREKEVAARSPLALLNAQELRFYARRGSSLRTLRRPENGGRAVDIELDEDGTVPRVSQASPTGARSTCEHPSGTRLDV